MQRRGLFVYAIIGMVALLGLAGCGRSDEDRADALCTEWAWDPNASAEENLQAYSEVWRGLESDGTVDLEGMARSQCEGHFNLYDQAAAARISALTDKAEQGNEDMSIVDFLESRRVSEAMVRDLGAVADRTDYSASIPMSLERAQGFAVVIIDVCDEVADGGTTWNEQLDQAVADGASVSDALEMNSYLRGTFCHGVS